MVGLLIGSFILSNISQSQVKMAFEIIELGKCPERTHLVCISDVVNIFSYLLPYLHIIGQTDTPKLTVLTSLFWNMLERGKNNPHSKPKAVLSSLYCVCFQNNLSSWYRDKFQQTWSCIKQDFCILRCDTWDMHGLSYLNSNLGVFF